MLAVLVSFRNEVCTGLKRGYRQPRTIMRQQETLRWNSAKYKTHFGKKGGSGASHLT